MNREIKFRAWFPDYDKMEEVTAINLYDGFLMTRHGQAFIEAIKLMQYTGLKDKKRTKEYPEGQEIYEGDIVKHESKYGHVAGVFKVLYADEFGFASFCLQRIGDWKPQYPGDTGWGGVLGSQGHLKSELEVIGNIFENPKLLKNTE